MVEGEAMSEWQYTPIENIAFALQDIANTLERIEKLMPVPGGEITSTETWDATPAEEVVEVVEAVEEVLPDEEQDPA
jgi:hypothetical protein